MNRVITLCVLFCLSCGLGCGSKGPGRETTPTLPLMPAAGTRDDTAAAKAPATQPGSEAVPAPDESDEDLWTGRTDLITAPPAAAPVPLALPKIERFVLPSGLKVLVASRRDLPIVSFHLAIGGGQGDELRDKRALADFVAAMLTKGTRSRSGDEIARTMDHVGGSLGAAADLESTHVTCDARSQDAATCLALLSDVTVAPAFPDEALSEVRDQVVSALKQLREDAGSLAAAHFENLLWGEDHVRGWPLTIERANSITRQDLKAWHAAHFVPQNAVLAVVGDVDPQKLRGELGRAFAGWKRGAAPKRKAAAEPKLKGRLVRLVDKPDQTQSHIVVGHLGLAHGDRDYFAAHVMNHVLGSGTFSSRLMRVVRAQGGKTYAASSGFERWRTRGAFMAQTFTQTAETLNTLGMVLAEIKRMKDAGPSIDELREAQTNAAGVYVLGFESASRLAMALVGAELHGLGEGYVRDFPLKVAAVSLDAARTAAARRLDIDNIAVVIVGRAAEVAPQLRDAGIEFETVGYLEPISRRDREAKRLAHEAPADPQKTEQGRQLLAAALAAKGGLERLKGLKDLVATGIFSASSNGTTVEGSYGRTFVTPDRLQEEIDIPGQGRVKMVVTDAAAWAVGQTTKGSQAQDLPSDAAAQLRVWLFTQPDMLLLSAVDPTAVVQALDPEPEGGKEYEVLQIGTEGGRRAKLLLDPESHLVHRVVYDLGGQETWDEYSDYRSVGGIQIAHRHRTESPIFNVRLDISYAEVKVNTGAVLPATRPE